MFTKSKKDVPGYVILSVVLFLGFLARVLWLGNIPGVNGDEAWYGLQVIGITPASWQTPSGLPLNPFFIIPLWVLQRIFPPAFWVLRMPAVLAGLLLIILGFLLLRRSLGVIPAVIFAVLSAGLPDLIAYSRFGWDTADTGLAMLFVLYFALSKKWWQCLIAVIAALIVHPSNIYALVIVIPLFGADHFRSLLGSNRGKKFLGVMATIFVVLIIFLLFDARHILPGALINQIISLKSWLGLFSAYGDLISGVMVYRFISTPVDGAALIIYDIIVWAVLVSTIFLGCWFSIRRKDYQIVVFLGGLLASLIVLHFSFLNEEFLPFNRYLQFLIVPTLLLVALCIHEIFPKGKSQWWPIGLAILLGFLGLASVTINYFVPLMTLGGQADRIYYTGPVEPKAAAAAFILRESDGVGQTTILAENWFVEKPIEYLLAKHPEFNLIQLDDSSDKPTLDLADIEGILKKGGFVVGFYQGNLDTTIMEKIHDPALGQMVVYGYANKPILIIWHKLPFPEAFTSPPLNVNLSYSFPRP